MDCPFFLRDFDPFHAGIIFVTSSLAPAADSLLELLEFLGDGV